MRPCKLTSAEVYAALIQTPWESTNGGAPRQRRRDNILRGHAAEHPITLKRASYLLMQRRAAGRDAPRSGIATPRLKKFPIGETR